jgi:hypothetical protein
MKTKSVIGICTLSILLAFTVLPQSTFRFQNYYPSAGIDAPVFDADGVRLAGEDYAAELWGGALSDSLSPTLNLDSGQRLILPFFTGTGAGYFTSTASLTVWAVPGGSFAWMQVRAWDTRLGQTYEAVAALGIGGYGESALLYIMGGNPLSLPTSPAPLVGLESFSLRPVVPEPSTWGLLALGGLAVGWALRRRLKRRL